MDLLLSNGSFLSLPNTRLIATQSSSTIAPGQEYLLPFTMSSGVGNRALAPWLASPPPSFAFISCNACAFVHSSPARRKAKLKFLLEILRKVQDGFVVVSMQEVHGSQEKLKSMLLPILSRFIIFSSHVLSDTSDPQSIREDCDGLLTLISKPSPPLL